MRVPSSLLASIVICTIVALAVAPPADWPSILVAFALGTAGVSVALWRSWTVGGRQATPWVWFAAGGVSSVIDNLRLLVMDGGSELSQAANPGNLFHLATAVCFLIGSLTLIALRRSGWTPDVILASTFAAFWGVVGAWEFVVEPAAIAGLPVAAVLFSLSFLAIHMMTVVVLAMLLTGQRRSFSIWLIAGSALMSLGSDVANVVVTAGLPEAAPGGHQTAVVLTSLISGGLAVCAALHPSARALTEPVPSHLPVIRLREIIVIFGSLLIIPIGTIFGARSNGDWTLYPLLGAIGTATVAWRAASLLLDRNRLIERFELMTSTLRDQATTDSLTGLPNRFAISGLLDSVLADRRADLRRCAVMFIDLDDFKIINDSLGHDAGDELLMKVASRLDDAVSDDILVGRFGGDEFVVVVPWVDDTAAALTIADILISSLRVATAVRDHEVLVNASIGLVVSDGHAATADSVLRDADTAMYQAKGGPTSVVAFDQSTEGTALNQLDAERDLRRAIEHGEIRAAYQPIMSLDSRQPIGVEVLARWTMMSGRTVAPEMFIPVAERSGQIHAVGQHILGLACAQWAVWNAGGMSVDMAVNVSAAELLRPRYATTLTETLARHEMPPEALTLELTERDLGDVDAMVDAVEVVRSLGVHIAVDDFGTGYFSLSQLRHLPVDIVKIDRSFVSGLGTHDADTAIVKAVVDLADGLGLRVVAEGVETPEQAGLLHQMGCAVAQGFLWAPGLSPEAVGDLLGVAGSAAADGNRSSLTIP